VHKAIDTGIFVDEATCLVYGLVDLGTFAVHYVGKSTSGLARPKHHGYPSVLSKDPTHKGAWLRKLAAAGQPYGIRVLEVCDRTKLAAAEAAWVRKGKEASWPLTNHCDGGEGLGHPPEHYARLAALFGGKPVPEARYAKMCSTAAARRGIPRDAATRAKLSKAAKTQFSALEGRLADSRAKGGCAIKDQHGTVYPFASEAARILGIPVTNIVKVLHGKRKSAGGRTFSYA
jgi:hypothetical protein